MQKYMAGGGTHRQTERQVEILAGSSQRSKYLQD